MKSLSKIRRQLTTRQFEFRRRAFRRAVERNISEQEIREARARAEVIENYSDDKYRPSGLLLGFTSAGRVLHFQVSFTESDLTKMVTIYEPNPDEWVDYRTRK